MSFESDLVQYPSAESTDALRPELFFAPPPQHTEAPPPELFDQDVAELDLSFPFEKFDDFLPIFYDSISVISTPPALTYSTDSCYSSDLTQSDYSIPSEIESYYPSENGLYGTNDSIHPAVSSNDPPSIPLHSDEAQFDFVTSDLNPNFIGISPEDLSTAMKLPPTPLPVHVTPGSEAQMAPASDRPFKSSKRKYNLKTHIGTHNKLKPFKCSICGGRFSRKNDLDRHRSNPSTHQKQMTMSRISKRRSNPNPDLPHRITINGDPGLTTSAYPDPTM
ncbi:hypothetical protein V8E52_004961 [Russula decolorans]